MAEPFVTVHRSYDPIQAELLGDLLRDNGIAAKVTGTRNAALLGVGQNILQLSIQVPNGQAASATEFLAAYFEADGRELLEQAGAYDVDDGEDADETAGESTDGEQKRALLAGGSVACLFGGSHWYAGRPYTAALLAVAQLYAIRMMLVEEWWAMATGMTTFGLLIVLDAGFGQLAVRSWNRGHRAGIGAQMGLGLVLAGAAVLAGRLAGPVIPAPEPVNEPAPPTLFAPG